MGQVINFRKKRFQKRKDWLHKHQELLFPIVCNHMQDKLPCQFISLLQEFQQDSHLSSDLNNYEDFRCNLYEIFSKNISNPLIYKLKKESWFDSNLMDTHELTEFCLMLFIFDRVETKNKLIVKSDLLKRY